MTTKMQEHLAAVKLRRQAREHRLFNWRRKFLRTVWRRQDRRFKRHIRSGEVYSMHWEFIGEQL